MREVIRFAASGLLFVSPWFFAVPTIGSQGADTGKPSSVQGQRTKVSPEGESYEAVESGLEGYFRVLDAVFAGGPVTHPTDSIVLVVRYVPSRKPESELLLRRTIKGQATIDYRYAEPSVYETYENALRNKLPSDPASIKERVTVRRKHIDISSRRAAMVTQNLLSSWERSVNLILDEFTATERTGLAKLILDGTRYQISLSLQAAERMTLVLDGPEVPVGSSDDALPIVKEVSRLLQSVKDR